MLAPLVAQQQGAQTARNLLTVAGLDVTAVSPLPWSVTDGGRDSVSAMSFTIEDFAGAVTLIEGDRVTWWDLVRDVARFAGFAMSFDVRPMAGTGRWIDVRAVGIDALLDWAVGPAYPVNAASSPTVASVIQGLIAAAQFPGGGSFLRAFVDPANTFGSAAYPIGSGIAAFTVASYSNWTIPAGSLRSQLRYLLNPIVVDDYGSPHGGAANDSITVLVDSLGGVRCWYTGTTSLSNLPSDWTTLAVTDGPAGTAQAEGLVHTTDAGSAYRGAYVIGGSAAGTGPVGDGSGRPGPVSLVSDSTVTTPQGIQTMGWSSIRSQVPQARGTVSLIGITPPSSVHAGGYVSITDANAGLSAGVYRIGAISKTVRPGGLEDWAITYGGPSPSYVDRKGRV